MNASDLLAAYRDARSERAFSDLVHHYANLVFSVAKRRLGDGTLAEDVTQTVFMRLAKAPPKVRSDAELAAWLHRTTVHVAIDFWRSETRRRTREQQTDVMQSPSDEGTRAWDEMSPHLDQALDELNDGDRQAVLLRFFERKPMREIGLVLGISEDAAKMRVSRAIDRLRHQLSVSGITCTVVLLATILPQRSMEAAPGHLLAKLSAIKLPISVAAGVGGLASLLPALLKSKAGMGVAALVILATIALFLNRNSGHVNAERPLAAVESGTTPSNPTKARLRRPFPRRADVAATPAAVPENVRFVMKVIAKETGRGLVGADVRAAYFYAGGIGEGHSRQTDADGNVAIPNQDKPEKSAGLNVFVGIEGYVPKAISFGRLNAKPENYVLELDSALAVGGVVVDESGQPVPGVTMQAASVEDFTAGSPNTDFQRTTVMTDAHGRWLFRYVPKEYASLGFSLTCTNYAVTQVSVAVGTDESLKARLVIKRGYVVTGRVTDSENRPVIDATVKELHNYGYRRLSTKTDSDGVFELIGLAAPHGPNAELVVQATGLAAEMRSVQLLEPTNVVDFILAPAKIFRGRVIDETGNPIPQALVQTDMNFATQVNNRFDWNATTDAEGRFEWNSAPAEETCFWFEADGYETIRGRPMFADGSNHEIKLTRKGE